MNKYQAYQDDIELNQAKAQLKLLGANDPTFKKYNPVMKYRSLV